MKKRFPIIRRHYPWLEDADQWRIGYAFNSLRFFPRWIFQFITETGYSKDFEQMMQMAIFISMSKRFDATAQGRIVQAEFRDFLPSVGIRKSGGQWAARVFCRSDEETESLGFIPPHCMEDRPETEPRYERTPFVRTELYNSQAQTKFREANREYRQAYQRAWDRGIKITKKEWDKNSARSGMKEGTK